MSRDATRRETERDAIATLDLYRAHRAMIATAESCTGGLIAAALTEIAGSSGIVDRGFVTYSNEAKIELLGVHAALIATHGAVSEPVARAMAEGALARSRATVTIAVTGIAGPGGGTAEKPVGTVWLARAHRGHATTAERHIFPGTRTAVRNATVNRALAILQAALSPSPSGRGPG